MDPLQVSLTMSRPGAYGEALSALPGAPVVAHRDSVPAIRNTRGVLANVLHQLADAVAPPARAPQSQCA
jgi:hypothetical protein